MKRYRFRKTQKIGRYLRCKAKSRSTPDKKRNACSDDFYTGEAATTLMPQSVREKLLKSPLYSKEGQGKKAEVIVKYFNPYGAGTWLITEGEEQEGGDWQLFGMCHLFEWEWGYIMLSELKKVRVPPFGLGIERDLYSSGTVAELMGEDYDAV